MADHHVRIILEAVNKGSAGLRNFFRDSDREVKKFRKSLGDAGKDLEVIFTPSGARGRTLSGQFASLQGDLNKTAASLRKVRQEAREGIIGTHFLSGLRAGLNEERRIREEINRRMNLSEEDRRKKLEDLDRETHQRKLKRINDLEAAEVGEIRRVIAAEDDRASGVIDNFRSERRILQNQIRLNENLLSEKKLLTREERKAAVANLQNLRDEKNGLTQLISARIVERDSFIDSERRKIATLHSVVRDEENLRRRRLAAQITRPSAILVEQQVRSDLHRDIDRDSDSVRRFGAAAGRAYGQFRTGLRIAKNGLTDQEKEILKNSNAFTRLGARIGAVGGSISAFRARTIVLISLLQILGTLVVQLGAAFVALASSAILAAAALGGALLAGVSQLLPVVGLLATAFSRLGKVLDAANLADKLALTRSEDTKNRLESIKQATQRLADSRYALMKAGEAVKDSEYDLAQAQQAVKDAIKDQREAVKELANARKQAVRDIIDANLEEKEAALALQEAELGILDAKRRLREEEQRSQLGAANIADAQAQVREAQQRLVQARAQGDTAEIATALQQLSVAEQDLQQISNQAEDTRNNIKQAQIDVKQAEVNREQAVIRNKRAQEDAAKLRKQGVEGSDRVVQAQKNLVQATKSIAQAERQQVLAQRALRDSVHSLVVAKREERDAEQGLTEARTKATAQQEQLQQALGDLSPAEKKLFNSIQRIKKIYKDNFRGITDIIIESFARAVDKIAPLLQDPKILKGATTLAEAIAASVDKLSDFAISPEFKHFLEFSLKNAAENVPKLTDGFISLSKVLIRIAEAATPIFNKLLDRFVNFLGRLEKGTRDTSGLEKFFKIAGEHLDSWIAFAVAVGRVLGYLIKFSAPSGKGMLDDLTAKLNEWADWLKNNGPEARQFFARMRVQVTDLARALTRMTVILFKAFSSKQAAQLTTFILDTVIPAFTIFLELLSLISGGLVTLFEIPGIGPALQFIIKYGLAFFFLFKLIKTFLPLWMALRAAMTFVGVITGLQAFSTALLILGAAIKVVGVALRFVFISNPWIAVIVAIIAAIVLLDRKFHFLAPTIKFIGKLFKEIFNWIKDHWKLLVAILLGPFGLVLIGIIKWHDKILGIIKAIVGFVREHWKLILAILLAPFLLGGAVILAIVKWREKIYEIIKAIPGKIVKFFESLPGLLKKIFDKIPGLLSDALKGLGGIVKSAIEKIPGGKQLLGLFGGGKSDDEKFAELIKEPSLDKQDIKKAKRLHSQGAKVREIIEKLFKDQGIDEETAKNLFTKYVFAHGGSVPGGDGQAVPIIAHAGEWVLNKEQQKRVAQALGISIEQARNIIFGTKMDEKGKKQAKGLKDAAGLQPFHGKWGGYPGGLSFNLVPKTDPDGIVVWFIEMEDGAFGQVSPRDARRIIASKGRFIPGYVRRSTHGFKNFLVSPGIAKAERFLRGGVVSPRFMGPLVQSFAEGGTVLQQGGFGSPSITTSKNITQHFEVRTEGETDWNYVMRLGALHAQSSYT